MKKRQKYNAFTIYDFKKSQFESDGSNTSQKSSSVELAHLQSRPVTN